MRRADAHRRRFFPKRNPRGCELETPGVCLTLIYPTRPGGPRRSRDLPNFLFFIFLVLSYPENPRPTDHEPFHPARLV